MFHLSILFKNSYYYSKAIIIITSIIFPEILAVNHYDIIYKFMIPNVIHQDMINDSKHILHLISNNFLLIP